MRAIHRQYDLVDATLLHGLGGCASLGGGVADVVLRLLEERFLDDAALGNTESHDLALEPEAGVNRLVADRVLEVEVGKATRGGNEDVVPLRPQRSERVGSPPQDRHHCRVVERHDAVHHNPNAFCVQQGRHLPSFLVLVVLPSVTDTKIYHTTGESSMVLL